MSVSVIRRAELTSDEVSALSLRIKSPEHEYDNGAIRGWGNPAAEAQMYVAFIENPSEPRQPFGLLVAGGLPDNTVVGWWIDKQHRGKRLGGPMIDAMAQLLRNQGVTRIGRITIDTFAGQYQDQSSALAIRLKKQFNEQGAA